MRYFYVIPLFALLLLLPDVTYAHAFAIKHDLPVPLYYYTLGAGLVVALSFVVAVFIVREKPSTKFSSIPLITSPGKGFRAAKRIAQALGLFVFLLIITTGLFGEQSPTRNFAPIFVWSLWWVGIVYIQVLVVDIWSWSNPWRTTYDLAIMHRLPNGLNAKLEFPSWVSQWPAVLTFFLFVWLEQISPMAERPSTLSVLIIIYSLYTWLGMVLYGRDKWLEQAEPFTILFTYLGRIAPLMLKNKSQEEGLWMRWPGLGLLVGRPLNTASCALLLLFLASVTFDGFRDTSKWSDILEWCLTQPYLFKPLLALQQMGIDLQIVIETSGLIVTPLIFVASYYLVSRLSVALTNNDLTVDQFAGLFILTFLPISFAYHVAHYFTFLLLAGQLAIPVLSDPFALGWDLFGTGSRQLNVGIIGVEATWTIVMGAVVIGHVYAVYIAHLMAIRVVKNAKVALISQLPIVVLMIAYTMASLWILAQPIVKVG